ncbi:MAG TPA: alpha/beta hydrolase [Acidimicrobiales bacterium]
MSTASLTLSSIRTADDTEMPYASHGPSTGPALVMLHGLSDSWRSFEPVFDVLAPDVRAIAVSLRGHGDAGRPEAGYELGSLAADVVSLLERLELDAVVLVGHSLGAAVALLVARQSPDRLQALVLIGAFATPADHPLVAELVGAVAELADPVDRAFIEEFQAGTVYGDVPEAYMAQVVAESAKVPAHVWRGATDGFMAADHLGAARAIAVPTTLIWGDHDAYVPRAEQDRFLATFPSARLEVYEDTGHAVHWEQPTRVVTDLLAILGGCSTTRSSTAG